MRPKANEWGGPNNPMPHSQTMTYSQEPEPPKVVLYNHKGEPLTHPKPDKRLGFLPERAK